MGQTVKPRRPWRGRRRHAWTVTAAAVSHTSSVTTVAAAAAAAAGYAAASTARRGGWAYGGVWAWRPRNHAKLGERSAASPAGDQGLAAGLDCRGRSVRGAVVQARVLLLLPPLMLSRAGQVSVTWRSGHECRSSDVQSTSAVAKGHHLCM